MQTIKNYTKAYEPDEVTINYKDLYRNPKFRNVTNSSRIYCQHVSKIKIIFTIYRQLPIAIRIVRSKKLLRCNICALGQTPFYFPQCRLDVSMKSIIQTTIHQYIVQSYNIQSGRRFIFVAVLCVSRLTYTRAFNITIVAAVHFGPIVSCLKMARTMDYLFYLFTLRLIYYMHHRRRCRWHKTHVGCSFSLALWISPNYRNDGD